ncbi:hypothetical protein [Bordetella sp. LUAb4]|uniref:hypothetical protein n=1 Tax=Bordetella sp. LUAb4 TaxID=2843195 RepID=UPI001E30459E|nr:hypothetical protein [Bordetella sp. LUAb4]
MLSALSAIGAAISQTVGRKSNDETSTRGIVGDQTFMQQEGTPRTTMRKPATSKQQASLPSIKESRNPTTQRHSRKNAATPEEMRMLTNGSEENRPKEPAPKERTYVGNCKRMIEKTKGHAPGGAR